MIAKKLNPNYRAAIALLLSLITFFLLPANWFLPLRFQIAWDVFAITFVLLSIYVIANFPSAALRKKAEEEDGSRWFVFGMIIIATVLSLLSVVVLISNTSADINKYLYLLFIIIGIVAAWMVVHIIFTFHYALLYYKHENEKPLLFSNEPTPDYSDFAYFSFTIGCAFQVSDVATNSRQMRKVVLLHSLISFAINTMVVALSINIVADMIR